MFDLGKILQELRLKRGYTQKEVAQKLNVSAVTVCNWEGNEMVPSTEHLMELSVLYNVSLNLLVGIEEEHVIRVEYLTEKQQRILNDLVMEFQDGQKYKNMTKRQSEIFSGLLEEFGNVE